MILLSITDYLRSLENPYGLFRTLGEVKPDRDIYGDIKLRCGNSAAVFTYTAGEKRRFLKCYVRPNPYLRAIYAYVERVRSPLLGDFRLLEEELYVHTLSGGGCWADVIEGEWTEGETLDAAIARAAMNGDADTLARLAAAFDALCRELLAQEWAHGDLKPENMVSCPDGRLTLIDCDAMWIPELNGARAVELGTPGYRHPARDASRFDKRIDDYPMMLISASLHALASDPGLFRKYNTTDNILFSPAELVAGGSDAFTEAAEIFARRGMARELAMLRACCQPFPDVDDAARYFFVPGQEGIDPHPFERGGKWGFRYSDGRLCIGAFWDEALDFRHGFAAVHLGPWWHIVDERGEVVESGLESGEMKRILAETRGISQGSLTAI